MAARAARAERRVTPAALLGVALIGAALGAGWDLFHVRTHTTIYASGVGRLPWWVPLEFAFVYLVGVLGIRALGAPAPDERTRARLAFEAAWVTVVYAMTAVLHRHEAVVAIVAAVALASRARSLRSLVRANPIPAAAIVAGGPVVEAILIGAGVFRYTFASLGNIPVWLPLLYANAVPFAIRLAEAAIQASDREPARERAR